MQEIKDYLDRIEKKIDRLDDRQDRAEIILAKQSIILDEHIKRTALLEKVVQEMDEKKIAPIAKHVGKINFAFRCCVFVGAAAVGLAEILTAFGVHL